MERALRIVIKTLIYTAVLPLFGFVIFGILTIVPLFGLFLGTTLVGLIYIAGALPCFVTGLCFEVWFREMRFARCLFLTCATGCVASIGWFLIFQGPPDRLNGAALYVYFALGLTGAVTAAIIPLAYRALHKPDTNPYALVEGSE